MNCNNIAKSLLSEPREEECKHIIRKWNNDKGICVECDDILFEKASQIGFSPHQLLSEPEHNKQIYLNPGPACKEHRMYPCAQCYPKPECDHLGAYERLGDCPKCGEDISMKVHYAKSLSSEPRNLHGFTKADLDEVRLSSEDIKAKMAEPSPEIGDDDHELFMSCVRMLEKRFKDEEYEIPDTVLGRLAALFKDKIKEAREEGLDEGWSATKLLWDRMEIWQNEWQAEKPKERALTHKDALRLIEWKLEKEREETEKRKDKFIDLLHESHILDLENTRLDTLAHFKAQLRKAIEEIEGLKRSEANAKASNLDREHNETLDDALEILKKLLD